MKKLFTLLCATSLICSCGKKQENEPVSRDEAISFYQAETKEESDSEAKITNLEGPYTTGKEFTYTQVDGPKETYAGGKVQNIYDLPSKWIYLKPGALVRNGNYTIVVEKDSHQDDQRVGIYQVCGNDQCINADNPSKQTLDFVINGDPKTIKQAVQVHYFIAESAKPSTGTTYRVRVKLLDKEQQLVGTFKLAFRFNQ